MIYIGIGANLPAPGFDTPLETCRAAVDAIEKQGVSILEMSRWYASAPVPVSAQPWFVNGIVRVDTLLEPASLLARLLSVENDFGRRRGEPNAARALDLDIIAMGGTVSGAGGSVTLPHPRMHVRAFVLLPLAELAPDWRHPVTGLGIDEMIRNLPKDQTAEPIEEG